MHDALFYKALKNDRLQCLLCPRYCKLKPGQHGFCYVRKNVDGRLKSLVYGKPYAVNVDPIEKKPLFHFLPGSSIVSIGTAGCNMACKYCQNWDISEAKFNESRAVDLPPERVVQMAQHYNSASIAYTYNEPTIFAEYAMDTAMLAHQTKIKNVMVTNGYITPEAIDEVYQHMDGANVDLKAFNEKFYQQLTLSHLDPILASLKRLKELGVWIEITTLVIPTYNDDEKEIIKMCEWIIEELDAFVPMHFTAFHPDYKLKHTASTTPSTLLNLRNLAMKVGIKYAYVGNVSHEKGSSTYCHQCNSLLIRRSWYQTKIVKLKNGNCGNCGTKIPGILN